jgi:hypothetical protein
LGGAAAAERQNALNALDMDCSSCGFGSVRSRPAMIIKGAARFRVFFAKKKLFLLARNPTTMVLF